MDSLEVLTAEQVDQVFHIGTKKTLANWRSAGKGPKFIKAGHKILYRVADVHQWLESRVFASTSDYGQKERTK
jgi:helix-turn-helix protein